MAHAYHNCVTESDNYGFYAPKGQQQDINRTQYSSDYNYLHELRQLQEQEWRIKKNQEEAKLMKDKPRTYEYTAPYDSYNPPRDVNRFFHDSKYDEKRPPLTPASDYADETVPPHRNPGTSLTTYARQYIGPRRDATQQPAGGLYVLRYDGSGCKAVNVALKRLQTIIKSYEGHVLGIAANDNVFVMSGDSDWVSSKQQQKKRNIDLTYRSVDQSVAILWFPNGDKAFDFFSNTFRNPFKENGFPTQHGYECFYIPMVTPPMLKSFDAYVFMELQDPQNCNPEELVQFEAELRQEMLNCVNNCLPLVASCHKGRENFKPGSLFKTNSKVYVNRFNYMQDVAHVWNKGIIQRCAQKHGIDISRMNIFAVSLKDWLD